MLRWLGLGALAAAGVWALREPRRRRVGGRRPLDPAGGDGTPVPSEPGADAPGAALSAGWVSAPSGTLRLLECHPEASFGVVLVHGLGGTAEHWRSTLEAFGPAVRGMAFDLPGHGDSDAAGETDLDALASALEAAMIGAGLRRAVLVGHNLGALVALRFARRFPRKVTGLLLLDPPGDPSHLPDDETRHWNDAVSSAPHEALADGFRQLLLGAGDAVATRVLADLDRCAPEALAAGYRATTFGKPLDDLDACTAPCRVLYTSLDDHPASFHRLRPALDAVPLTTGSHWPMLDEASGYLRALDDFLDLVRATPDRSTN